MSIFVNGLLNIIGRHNGFKGDIIVTHNGFKGDIIVTILK